MTDEPIFGNCGIKIILIEKKEYYLIYEHNNIPKLTKEMYDNIISKTEPDINLGSFILYDKQRTKDGRYIKITPIYKLKLKTQFSNMEVDTEVINEKVDVEQKEGILMTDSINLNLLESDFNLLNKVMMILEGRNSSNLLEKTPYYYNFPYLNNKNNAPPSTNKQENVKKSNDVLKIDFNEKKLKIISIVNRGINMILFSIDINVEYIPDLNELLEIAMKNFKKKSMLIKSIDEDFKTNLKNIEELNRKKMTITTKNKQKCENLMNFIITELNKKKKNNCILNDKINSLFMSKEEKKEIVDDKIEEEKEEEQKSDISLGSIAEEINKENEKENQDNTQNQNQNEENNNDNDVNMNNDADNDSNLSLTDL